jgi:DNA-binding GntR family transcriptional regulator
MHQKPACFDPGASRSQVRDKSECQYIHAISHLAYSDVMPLDVVIDRRSPIPLYYQLSQQLEQAIDRGDLKPGDRIDTEVDLAERFGLSRPTVRQAIQELVTKGMLVRRRGVGTQVVGGHVRRQVELTSLYDDLVSAEHRPSTKVLSLAIEPATPAVASELGVSAGTQVVHLERLRLDGGQPLAIMRNWLPADAVQLTAADLEATGLYDILRRTGVHIRVANQWIGATAATAAEARALKVKAGAPLVTMARVSFDHSGRAIEYASHSYRSDRYQFETTLVAR